LAESGRGVTWFFELDKEPALFHVPSAVGFWVYAFYDARTGEFSEIGKQFGTKTGLLSDGRSPLRRSAGRQVV
jgi:hypothetical protein